MNLKQRYLQWRTKHSKKIYVVCLWAKWCAQEAPLYSFKKGEPQVILWTDHNGFKEEYYIGAWYNYSTGARLWFNTKQQAEAYCKNKNILEDLKSCSGS